MQIYTSNKIQCPNCKHEFDSSSNVIDFFNVFLWIYECPKCHHNFMNCDVKRRRFGKIKDFIKSIL